MGVDPVPLRELEEEDGEAVAREGAEEVQERGAGLRPGGGDEGVLHQLEEPPEERNVAEGVADLWIDWIVCVGRGKGGIGGGCLEGGRRVMWKEGHAWLIRIHTQREGVMDRGGDGRGGEGARGRDGC